MRVTPDRVRRVPSIVLRSLVGLISLALSASALQAAFPDAHNPPPAGWTGPVFKLSQSYPATLPILESTSRRPWTQFDFRDPAQAPKYLKAVLDYCLAGNTANSFADVGANTVRKWYHAPWLHSGDSGREFIHGLTKERPSKPPELGVAHATDHDNWAVGFYNARGAFTIGQVWKDPSKPNPAKAKFPTHTVSCKLLFTTTPIAEAPYLAGTLEWDADINRASGTAPRPKVRLLQVDLAVKDPRANPTIGWVFGTYQYEKDASTSANWWEHLVPVGLMWGSDVEKLKLDQPTRENWINTHRGVKLHLGRKDLVLNGPVDNPRGSCTSCHGFAQVPKVNGAQPALPTSPPALNASTATLEKYFKNIKAATDLSSDYTSLDYSLQLQIGIARAVAAGAASLPSPQSVGPSAAAPGRRAPLTIPEVTRGQ